MWWRNRKHLVIMVQDHRLVYLVAQRSRREGISVLKQGIIELPQAIVEQGSLRNPDSLATHLGGLRRHCRTKTITIGLPGHLPHRAVVPVGNADSSRIRETVEKYIAMQAQFRLRNRVVEYEIVGPGDAALAAITAVGQDLVDAYVQVARRAGFRNINVEYIDDVVAAAHVSEEAKLVLHIGRDYSLAAVASDSIILQHEYIPVGVQDIVRGVASSIGVSKDEARRYVTEFGIGPHGYDEKTTRCITDALEPLAYQVRRIVGDWYQKGYKNYLARRPLEHIELYGEGSQLAGWPDFLERACRCRTDLIERWHHDRVMEFFLAGELPDYLPVFLLAEKSLQVAL